MGMRGMGRCVAGMRSVGRCVVGMRGVGRYVHNMFRARIRRVVAQGGHAMQVFCRRASGRVRARGMEREAGQVGGWARPTRPVWPGVGGSAPTALYTSSITHALLQHHAAAAVLTLPLPTLPLLLLLQQS